MGNTRKIAFWGTPDFTIPFLDLLYKDGLTPSLIVTNPNRPSGRGMHIHTPAPAVWAQTHNIEVVQPEKIDDIFFEELKKKDWDLFIVIAYGNILPEKIITLPKFGTINIHYSLLPKYRGATPVESAIINGDNSTGVCIQQMRYKLDSGPILAQKEVPVTPTETTATLRDKLNTEALILLPEVINSIFQGEASPKDQDDAKATICKRIKKEDGEIFLDDNPIINDRKFRAYVTSPGVFFMTKKDNKNIRVKIKNAHLEGENFILDLVVPENGKPMTREEFFRWQND